MSVDGRPKVFISYSHVDVEWKDRLVKHLRVLGEEHDFDVWDDERIDVGAEWEAAIDVALKTACVAILLVSADFLASRFIRGKEVPPLLERREREQLPIVPVIVWPCGWKKLPWLSRLQARPRNGQPLSGCTRHEAEEHLTQIADEVDALLRRAVAPAAPAVPTPTPPKPVPSSQFEPLATAPAAPVSRVEVAAAPPVVVASSGDEIEALAARLGVTLRPFTFETVRLDERGAVVERRKLESRLFVEDLGEGVTLEMVAIPSGSFRMGSPNGEDERTPAEGPQRDVAVEPFFLGRFVITQAQWARVATLPRSERDLDRDPSNFKGARRPVESVSWHDAMEFCARLARETGRTYRLPSEAEWEYAARAGTTTPFAFGPTITPAFVNYKGTHPYGKAVAGEDREATHNVGALGVANAWGLADMHGNVWEWTLDPWHENYRRAPSDGRVWDADGDDALRVVRGGSWYDNAAYCRSAYRGHTRTDSRYYHVGFRVLCSVARTS